MIRVQILKLNYDVCSLDGHTRYLIINKLVRCGGNYCTFRSKTIKE